MLLSIRKLTKADLQPIVDKIADMLPGWKATLMSTAGRAVLVKAVLTAVPVYLLIALDVPKWLLRAIDKMRRAFLWKGRRQVNGEHCPVAWERACRPIELGGLGIHNLETFGWALRMRWLWLSKTDPKRPWAAFNIKVHPNVTAMFAISVSFLVGNGRSTLFWKDRWFHGKPIEDLAPALVPFVSKRARSRRTVHEAMQDLHWVSDIGGGLSVPAIVDYLKLWDALENVQLLEDQPDQHLWTPKSSGSYSAHSAYARFFVGSTTFEPSKRLWKSWAPIDGNGYYPRG